MTEVGFSVKVSICELEEGAILYSYRLTFREILPLKLGLLMSKVDDFSK